MSIYSDSERRPIYYNIGPINAHRNKYVKAPFDMIKIAGEWALETISIGGTDMSTYIGSNAIVSDDDHSTEEFVMGREEGWLSDVIVIEQHEMGDLRDTWMGVNRFSQL